MSVKFSREVYGWDRFSKISLTVGIFLFVTRYAMILGIAIIIYSIWRSKSSRVRGRNNTKFVFENTKRGVHHNMDNLKKNIKLINIKKNMELINKKIKNDMELISNKIKKYKPMESLKQRRKYIITSCPKCQQKLRLPKGKGKIIATCSKCSSVFRLKT
ncbi:zinc-ribbon domain-containing protein [Clostridium bowmanii]|uniref:zinc-ribbon domain-containing protein n=1 Tax=Clostridium bowmanii TaxID=132925 RepID=UPI001C0B3437|nr:zinc-ribbon domain-containing protein [Clostridium bowmanii]MBU3189907.1 zinc-ribbon domain-containing protein [Clostridium bowmanii]MCA1074391.1 zinc-ribbon domain-containing protein [Clostridium bowmanii]